MILFDESQCIDLCCKNKNQYVLLAVQDFIKDFTKVSKCRVSPRIVEEETEWCIVIEENISDGCEPVRDEGFHIKREGRKIRFFGAGYLGTMWAIYTFSERILGIDPCYIFNDFDIEPREKLEVDNLDIRESPSAFGFRGVFINDEDFLTGWKDGGKIRYVDEPFYGVTVEESVMEKVVETVLRLRLNLIIPATFLAIDNPSEKALTDCAAKRGIYLSQHHVEPLGVSSFSFANYCKKHEKKGKFSYSGNPQLLEEVWRYYAEKWAEYKNVVWQLGLRGMGDDRPIWQDEIPTEETLRESGEYISYALSRQKEIVMEVTNGKAKYFTSTLWMEGSSLMSKNLLKVPEDVIVVFADNGPCQMYGPDFEMVSRDAGTKYGIYYHVQYYSCGPHLVPMTGVDKLYYNVRRAYQKGDISYFILNASNIREFVYELGAYSDMMWNLKDFSAEDYLQNHAEKFYGKFGKNAQTLIRRYFDIIPSLDKQKFSKHFEKYFNYDFATDYGKIKNFTAKDGLVIEYGSMLVENFTKDMKMELHDEMYHQLKDALENYRVLCSDFKVLAESTEESLKKHIEVKWLCFVHTLKCLYEWYISLYEAKKYRELGQSEKFKESVNLACQSLESLLEYRKCAEYGYFENWYRGDTKMNVKQCLYNTKRLLGQTPFC